MTDTLVDANVLLDVWLEDPRWQAWSADCLSRARKAGDLVINPLIFAEVSLVFDGLAEAEEVMSTKYFEREDLPWEAAFLAGKAFTAYRRRGGPRRSPLPDFYIGAHAEVRGYRLLTRDTARYATYFPSVDIISPETHP